MFKEPGAALLHELSCRGVALVTSGDAVLEKLTALLGPPEPCAVFEERLRFTPTSESGNLNFAINTVEFLIRHGQASATDMLSVTYVGAASGGKDSGIVSVLKTEASAEFRHFLSLAGFRPVADLLKKGWKFPHGRMGFDVLLYQPMNIDETGAQGVPVFSQALVLEIEVTGDAERFEERKRRAEAWFVANLKTLCSTDFTLVKT